MCVCARVRVCACACVRVGGTCTKVFEGVLPRILRPIPMNFRDIDAVVLCIALLQLRGHPGDLVANVSMGHAANGLQRRDVGARLVLL